MQISLLFKGEDAHKYQSMSVDALEIRGLDRVVHCMDICLQHSDLCCITQGIRKRRNTFYPSSVCDVVDFKNAEYFHFSDITFLQLYDYENEKELIIENPWDILAYVAINDTAYQKPKKQINFKRKGANNE